VRRLLASTAHLVSVQKSDHTEAARALACVPFRARRSRKLKTWTLNVEPSLKLQPFNEMNPSA
jgi:homogentisate 1,2-dioxygenase